MVVDADSEFKENVSVLKEFFEEIDMGHKWASMETYLRETNPEFIQQHGYSLQAFATHLSREHIIEAFGEEAEDEESVVILLSELKNYLIQSQNVNDIVNMNDY